MVPTCDASRPDDPPEAGEHEQKETGDDDGSRHEIMTLISLSTTPVKKTKEKEKKNGDFENITSHLPYQIFSVYVFFTLYFSGEGSWSFFFLNSNLFVCLKCLF